VNSGPISVKTLGRIDLPLTPVDWVIPNLFERKKISVLYGKPGLFKSTLAVALGYNVVYGKKWQQQTIKQDTIALIPGEGFLDLRRRMDAWIIPNGYKDDQNDRFRVYTYEDDNETFNLLRYSHIIDFCKTIQSYHKTVSLVIFDTLNSLIHGARENEKIIAKVLEHCNYIAERLNCAVVILHHPNAAGTRERGTSVLRSNVNAMLEVVRVPTGVGIIAHKQRNGPTDILFQFRTNIFTSFVNNKEEQVPWLEFDGIYKVESEHRDEDQDFRDQIIRFIEPGESISASELCDRMDSNKGRHINNRIKKALPYEQWWPIKVNGEKRELRVIFLGQGRSSKIECRFQQ
jgi:hypothetical protein